VKKLAHFDSAGKCCFAALANSGALSRYGKGTTLHIEGQILWGM
jgi:hypothetical protein